MSPPIQIDLCRWFTLFSASVQKVNRLSSDPWPKLSVGINPENVSAVALKIS